MGTALTEDQIQEAWRVVDVPTCCFDGDLAGRRAAVRSVDRVLPILKAGNSLQYVFLTGAKDPDEFLKTLGREAFDKAISEVTPLKDLLWQKNVDGIETSTPEQKALVEKNIKEEVAKIADETVRNYYIQEMQDKIYNELGKGASWRKRQQTMQEKKSVYGQKYRYDSKNNASIHQAALATPKVHLDELVAKYVVSALVLYPSLIDEYEEKIYNFNIKNQQLSSLLENITEINQEEKIEDFAVMTEKLKARGLQKSVDELLEFKMLKIQNPNDVHMRENLDLRILESQIKQLDAEIKECLRVMETSESLSDDIYKRYESLKKEKENLLAAQDFD